MNRKRPETKKSGEKGGERGGKVGMFTGRKRHHFQA